MNGMPGWKRRIISTTTLLALLFCVRAQAHVFEVTDTNDTTAITSLRGAIIAANADGGENTIILGEGPTQRRHEPEQEWTFYLTIQGADEDAAQTGDLDVTNGSLTIIGATTNVTINASALGDRVFQVFSNAELTLAGLTITGGNAPGGRLSFANGESGGAIYTEGMLRLKECVLSGNVSGTGNVFGGDFGTAGGDGGGIYNSGFLALEKCLIIGNSAGTGVEGTYGGYGGAIRNDGTAEMIDCQITGNQSGAGSGATDGVSAGASGGNGGGIYNTGSMTLIRCEVEGNACGQATGGGNPTGIVGPSTPGGPGGLGGNGGGIYNIGKIAITFCTISSNTCSSGGSGGIFSWGGNGGEGGSGGGIFNTGNLFLDTCTISHNLCGDGGNGANGTFFSGGNGGLGGNGGGVFNKGLMQATSCTIAFNASGAGGGGGNGYFVAAFSNSPAGGGQGGNGGGVFSAGTNSLVTLRNTLVSLDTQNIGGSPGTNTDDHIIPTPPPQVGASGSNGLGPDLAGEFSSEGFNLIGAADGSMGFTNAVRADQVGTTNAPIDPVIGPLRMNGGPTPTHALLDGSPAINKGFCFGVHQDQRGEYRPFIYPGVVSAVGGDGSDIGAFELRLNERFERAPEELGRR